MKNIYYLMFVLVLFFSFGGILTGQSTYFDVTKYNEFLEKNKNLTPSQLMQNYPIGKFIDKISYSTKNSLYFDSISIKYSLTEFEKSLISSNGFMVSERLNYFSFGHALYDVYKKDMPLFISTDAILHAFHSSYDKILSNIETVVIVPGLKELLINLHERTSDLYNNYSSKPEMADCLKDYDIYITIALKLLGESVNPFFTENTKAVNELIALINKESAAGYKIFSETVRDIDFSQFKPRGHYTEAQSPVLAKYFRTMMWLGRIEFYLIPPSSAISVSIEDARRQSADAMLLLEAAELAGIFPEVENIERIIGFFVGEQDNVTLFNLKDLRAETGIKTANQLIDSTWYEIFKKVLVTKSYSGQKILSQILMQNPMSPGKIVPASAFMLFGQRFVLDSYITGNVTFDRVVTRRMLPSMLDILFSLGNDPAAKLLKPELDKYKYSSNLTSLRYLVDSYGSDFWESTIYNMWLNSIKSLNPPSEKSSLPEFMQTAAYWQEKMNTQLASWTELRHDNLLYAKQSYSGIPVCSYPYVYVEPIPEFYKTIKTMSIIIKNKFEGYKFSGPEANRQHIIDFFDHFSVIADSLAVIAQKEIDHIPFTEQENDFLKSALYEYNSGCTRSIKGWYPSLYYGDGSDKQDYLVADMHTSPADEFGNMVGWVKHCGTGPINMGVWVAETPEKQKVSFIGPVMSFYEYTTSGFLRLTDEEWTLTYQKTAPRPDFVNLYLADSKGETRGPGASITDVRENLKRENLVPGSFLTAQNYPNPFNPSTIINFTIPYDLANQKTELSVYNIQGEKIKTLVNEVLPSGNYFTRWDGKNGAGISVASGIYIYNLKTGGHSFSGKMNLIK